MNEKEKKKAELYLCDPIRYKDCPGNGLPHCGTECFCTRNPEMAVAGTLPLTEKSYRAEELRRHDRNFEYSR